MRTAICGAMAVLIASGLACSGGASAPDGYQEVRSWGAAPELTVWCIGFDDCGVMDDSGVWLAGPGCRIDTSRSLPLKSRCEGERGYIVNDGTFVAQPETGVAHEQGASEGRLWIQDMQSSESHGPLGRIYGWWLYDEHMSRIGEYGADIATVSPFDGGVASVVLADGRVTTVSMDGTLNEPAADAEVVDLGLPSTP